MSNPPVSPSLAANLASARALESLLAFWADAGVDTFYELQAKDRLSEGRQRLLARPSPAAHQSAAPPDDAPPFAAGLSPLAKPPPPPETLAAAETLAQAAATLEALSEAIAGFEGCPLKSQGARQAVFARGRQDARLMIIGEAPGAEEDIQGDPFVGRAGKLLDRILAAAQLTDEVFITNSVFWRPPANRTPSPEEQMTCAPFVERAISLVQPQVLLLLGGASAKFMLGRPEGILSLRGRWTTWTGPEGRDIPTLPSLHPAYLLRQPGAKKQAWSDLLAIRQRLDQGL